MKKTLYMHIGMPKTGTTSIQSCCHKNITNLKNNNINYPTVNENSLSHCEITQTSILYWPTLNSDDNLKKVTRELSESKNNALLSSEFFIFDDVDRYITIFNLFKKVYFIVYFRNIFDISNSALIQNTKTPETNQISLSNSIFFLPNSFYTWLNKLGRNNFIFKNYDALLHEGCLLKDFFQTIGIKDHSNFIFPKQKNASLKTPYTFFLRHLANISLGAEEWLKCVENITRLSKTDIHAPMYALIPSQIWDKQKVKVDAQISLEAELLQDPTWKDWSYAQRDKLPSCPYTQLPPEDQHRIFDALPEDLQSAIISAWPAARTARAHEPLLPPIYNDEILNSVLFRWRRIAFERQVHYQKITLQTWFQNPEISRLASFILLHCKTKCIYSLSAKHEILKIQQIKNIYWEKSELHIISEGNDPICFIKNFYIPNDSICIIHICGSGPSRIWQFFYYTENDKYHKKEHCINFDPHITPEQSNGAFIVLPSSAIGKNLRLDPGICAGEYIITKLDIFIIRK